MTKVERPRGRSEVELATPCLSRRSETREAGAMSRSLIHALRNDSSLVTGRCSVVQVAVTCGFELKRQPAILAARRDASPFTDRDSRDRYYMKRGPRAKCRYFPMALPDMVKLYSLMISALNINAFLIFHENEMKIIILVIIFEHTHRYISRNNFKE